MERIDDDPPPEQFPTANRPPESSSLESQPKNPDPTGPCSTKNVFSEQDNIPQQFTATSPEAPMPYPVGDTGVLAQPPDALITESLEAVDPDLLMPPPTLSSHHDDASTKVASIYSNTPPSHAPTSLSSVEDDGSSTAPPEQELTYEYHGPGSFLSICSKSGIEWVNEKTGVNEFGTIARGLISDISRALKLSVPNIGPREPEPDESLAWKYSRIYFDTDTDAGFGIISRPTFENALRAHFQKESNPGDIETDPGWYALRNVVYAAGCRILETKSAVKGFKIDMTATKSWKYFANALSVHNDILYFRTSLMAVQALAAMAFFVEAIGYPSIDYMLCSSAMRLAVSKGLHRQPPACWNLSPEAIKSRSLLWWSIYGFERVNANRSGRPLAIDDRDITCQMPEGIEDTETNLAHIRTAIEHAKLSSNFSRRIADLKSNQASLQEVASSIAEMTQQLDTWWDSLPDYMKLDLRNPSRQLPPSLDFQSILYHHYAYYGSVVAIHAVLVHPWNSTALKILPHEREEFARMTAESGEVFINATRKFVQYLPQLNINPLSPKWLVVVYPLMALVNLFIYVLQNPQSPATESDVGLMYLVAGHFSYLEYAVADRVFPSLGQMANLARLTADNARNRFLGMDNDLSAEVINHDASLQHLDLGNPEDFDQMHLDNEQWATLIGWPDNDDLMVPGMLLGSQI